VVRDITQQRAMERLKDDFLAIAAHELKTPVTAIKGYAQLALSRLQTDAEPGRMQRALQTIDQQAERIAHLVEELLDMSRIQAGQLHLQRTRLELVALAQRSIEQAQQSTTHHQFVLDAPTKAEGCWDEARLEQVLQNLLGNAMKYSPDGGTITTTIALLDDVVHVTVRDQGIGIPPDKQPRIFEPWFQAHTDTSGDYGGMGLGLSISREIVQRHGGHMWLESKYGSGSLFGFTLPLDLES
jgi:signal transduction histidine kinase